LGLAPEPGKNGGSGGVLTHIFVSETPDATRVWNLKGGEKGNAGKGGLVHPSKGVPAEHGLVGERRVTLKPNTANAFYMKTRRFYSDFIIDGISEGCKQDLLIHVKEDKIDLALDSAADKEFPREYTSPYSLEGGRDGAPATRPRAADGEKGKNGHLENKQTASLQAFLAAIPPEAAAPLAFKETLVQLYGEGKLGLE
jgi:hypothetical protein